MSWDKKKDETKKDEVKQDERVSVSIKELVKETVDGVLPALVAAQRMGQSQQQGPAMRPFEVARRQTEDALNSPECHVCRQKVRACNNEHTQMSVFPGRYPEFGRDWPGLTLNGIKYRSNDNQHLVDVPLSAADGFTVRIRVWEDRERINLIGRRGGDAYSNSGKRRVAESMGLLAD